MTDKSIADAAALATTEDDVAVADDDTLPPLLSALCHLISQSRII